MRMSLNFDGLSCNDFVAGYFQSTFCFIGSALPR